MKRRSLFKFEENKVIKIFGAVLLVAARWRALMRQVCLVASSTGPFWPIFGSKICRDRKSKNAPANAGGFLLAGKLASQCAIRTSHT